MTDVLSIIACQVYEFNDSEDGNTYFWNATAGRRLAEARNAEIVPIRLSEVGMTREMILKMAPDLNQRYALSLPGAALLSPILFVEHRGKHVLVDGWNRVFKAAVQGFPVLPAYVLTQAEADSIRLGGVGSIGGVADCGHHL